MLGYILILASYFLVMVFISSFSSAENLVFSLSADDIRELSSREDNASKWLSDRLKKPREFALLFVVVRTLLFTIAAILLFALSRMVSEWWFAGVCALVFWITVVLFGFAFPGGAIRGNKLEKALRKLPTIRFANVILAPFLILWKGTLRLLAPEGGIGGQLAIERELDALIPDEEGFAGLETEEKEMIRHVVEFGDTTVREVMVPRIDMVCIPADARPKEAVDTISKMGHSRIPIYEDRVDNIVGVLYAKDLLLAISKEENIENLRQIAREPYFVPEAKKTASLLRVFKKDRMHMAIVVDEYGGTAGLVTIEDLLEEIVGEIHDEYDAEEVHIKKLDDNAYLVDAKLPIDEINEALNIDLPEEDVETLGGFIYGLAEAIPVAGDKFEYEDLLLIVESVLRQRVKYVKIIIKEPEEN